MKFSQTWRIRKPEEDSESVYISERFGVRTLHIGSDTVQSSMRLTRPNDLEISYTRSMMAFLLFNPMPNEVLMIGLGGGSLAKFIYHRMPTTCAIAVEINPQVVTVAREFFQVPADGRRLKIVVGDGAVYVTEDKLRTDVIMVDGYDAESQSESLSTLAFYRNCARILGESGILVVNLWGGDRDFRTCIDRIAEAFDGVVACLPAGRPGNVVALAFKRSPGRPSWSGLLARGRELERIYALEFKHYVQDLAAMNPHDAERLLL